MENFDLDAIYKKKIILNLIEIDSQRLEINWSIRNISRAIKEDSQISRKKSIIWKVWGLNCGTRNLIRTNNDCERWDLKYNDLTMNDPRCKHGGIRVEQKRLIRGSKSTVTKGTSLQSQGTLATIAAIVCCFTAAQILVPCDHNVHTTWSLGYFVQQKFGFLIWFNNFLRSNWVMKFDLILWL